jgi:hypothetical protein
MAGTQWSIDAVEFTNCNCAYGCPCQFNALPTHGHCQATVGFEIAKGHHGETKLDGLRVAGMFKWPGPIHEGNGEACVVVDERADPAQRDALLRILTGQDTDPGATIFQVFSTTLTKLHDPIFAPIEFKADIDKREAHVKTAGVMEARAEPIRNPVTGAEHRIRINLDHGFEYKTAEVCSGVSDATGPIKLHFENTHGHLCQLRLTQSGIPA